MAFNVNNLAVSDVLSGTMFTKDGTRVQFGLNDISDPSLELGANPISLTDRLGVPIMQFIREKTATISGSNSTVSLNLLAAQMGSEKKVAKQDAPLIAPYKEQIQIGSGETGVNKTIKISKTPIAGTVVLELLDADRSPIGTNIPIETAASESAASVADTTITLPTGMNLTASDYIGVYYDYSTTNAVSAGSYVDAGVVSGKFELEVMFADKCNQAKLYYGFIVFPSAVLESSATLDLTVDGRHPFTINAMADYCGEERELFHIVVPES